MAKRSGPPPSSSRSAAGKAGAKAVAGANRGGRKKSPGVQVKQSRPWGLIAVSGLIAAALIGVLVFAFMNQGSGYKDPLDRADEGFKALQVVDKKDLSNNHVPGQVAYDRKPPVGGDHSPIPQTCAVYTEPIADEHAVHSLEHGAVWITYRPDLPADQVKKLAEVAERGKVLLSPYPGLSSPISLQAWGRSLPVDNADDGRIGKFVTTYADGPQTPERFAQCQGNSSPGPVQAAPGGGAGVPQQQPLPQQPQQQPTG